MSFTFNIRMRLRHHARVWLTVCALTFIWPAVQIAGAFPADGNDGTASVSETREGRLRVFDDVWETVRARYYDPALRGLDWEALGAKYRAEVSDARDQEELYTILRRMLAHLADPHTRVFPPGESTDWREMRFITVGVSLREVSGEIVVERVERGTEAERAGVRAGDALVNIDSVHVNALLRQRLSEQTPLTLHVQPTRAPGLRLRAIVKLFDGPRGSLVSATFRSPDGRERNVTLRREVSTHAPVLHIRRAGSRAVVEFNLFTPEIAAELVRALKNELKDARGLVLDLRDNGGGEAESMTDVASLFLPPGRSLGLFNDRAGRVRIDPHTRTALRSTADTPLRFDGPVVVLTSARTASAAEVFAAALKESGHAAAVIGETTCGCVLAIRRRHALPDGGILDVSELDYRTYKGTRLEGAGLEPDVRVAPTRRTLRDGKDTAMERAVEILKAANKNRSNGRR